MEINGIGSYGVTPPHINDVLAGKGRDAAKAPNGPGAAVPRDKAGLSDSAQALRAAMEAVGDAPEIRAELVQKFREAIANGTYQPDPMEIADRLLKGRLGDRPVQ